MNILKKDQPLSVLILADHLIACGDELYSAFSRINGPLTEGQAEALADYANASNAYHRALKQPEPSNVTSKKPGA